MSDDILIIKNEDPVEWKTLNEKYRQMAKEAHVRNLNRKLKSERRGMKNQICPRCGWRCQICQSKRECCLA